MSTSGPRRPYRSPQRAVQAAATRRAILAAATSLFLRSGYARTTVAAIARASGVAPETIYASFRTKHAVLAAAVDVAIVGDDEAVPLLDRPWVRALAAESSSQRRIEALAQAGSAILARRAPLDAVVREAAAGDPEIRELLDDGRADRRAGQLALLALVTGIDQNAAPALLDEAADAVFAIGSPEVYGLLVYERGWSHAQFTAWYASMLQRLLPIDREHSSPEYLALEE